MKYFDRFVLSVWRYLTKPATAVAHCSRRPRY